MKPYQQQLLDLAKESIVYGLEHGRPLPVDPSNFSIELQQLRATFVTLHINGELRGCTGTLEARRPLIVDIVSNAFTSAFRDSRFPPLSREELDSHDIHLSILSPPEQMTFSSEQELLSQLRPGTDGLILEIEGQRGTFLPSVWESLPEPDDFLNHLKVKTGLPADYWSDSVRVERYTTESFP